MFLYIPMNISSKDLEVSQSQNLPSFPLSHNPEKLHLDTNYLGVG